MSITVRSYKTNWNRKRAALDMRRNQPFHKLLTETIFLTADNECRGLFANDEEYGLTLGTGHRFRATGARIQGKTQPISNGKLSTLVRGSVGLATDFRCNRSLPSSSCGLQMSCCWGWPVGASACG